MVVVQYGEVVLFCSAPINSEGSYLYHIKGKKNGHKEGRRGVSPKGMRQDHQLIHADQFFLRTSTHS